MRPVCNALASRADLPYHLDIDLILGSMAMLTKLLWDADSPNKAVGIVIGVLDTLLFAAISIGLFFGARALTDGNMGFGTYALLALAYLAVVTLYWIPGEDRANQIELTGFTLCLAAAAVVGLIALLVRYPKAFALFS